VKIVTWLNREVGKNGHAHTNIVEGSKDLPFFFKSTSDSKQNFIFSERKNFLVRFVVLLFQKTVLFEHILHPHEYVIAPSGFINLGNFWCKWVNTAHHV
jgi:hypothetical protein